MPQVPSSAQFEQIAGRTVVMTSCGYSGLNFLAQPTHQHVGGGFLAVHPVKPGASAIVLFTLPRLRIRAAMLVLVKGGQLDRLVIPPTARAGRVDGQRQEITCEARPLLRAATPACRRQPLQYGRLERRNHPRRSSTSTLSCHPSRAVSTSTGSSDTSWLRQRRIE